MEIVFYINGDMPVLILGDLWDEMMELLDKDIDAGFNLKNDNDILINDIKYKILVSGLDILN